MNFHIRSTETRAGQRYNCCLTGGIREGFLQEATLEQMMISPAPAEGPPRTNPTDDFYWLTWRPIPSPESLCSPLSQCTQDCNYFFPAIFSTRLSSVKKGPHLQPSLNINAKYREGPEDVMLDG